MRLAQRIVGAEVLDALDRDDPIAQRARRDLQRVHRAMATRSVLAPAVRALRPAPHGGGRALQILELGAGDGSLLLGVARALGPRIAPVALTLLDRHDLLSQSTVQAFATVGWQARAQVCDVFDWVRGEEKRSFRGTEPNPTWDLVCANLFLHHFDAEPLARILRAVRNCAHSVFAVEPRRSWLALAGSHLIGAIGASAVTRGDAILSVRAGFRASEITQLWSAPPGAWELRECPAGLFSHCFQARRVARVRGVDEPRR